MKTQRVRIVAVALMAWALALSAGLAVAAGAEHAMKVGKKGDVTLTKETKVGDLTLKPGRYIFQHRVEGEDHFVHFTEVTKGNPYGTSEGGVPKAHPGEIKCKVEPLSKKVKETTLFLDSEDGTQRLVRAEVAGENVAHVF